MPILPQKDPDASDNVDRVGCLSHQVAHRSRKSDVWTLGAFSPTTYSSDRLDFGKVRARSAVKPRSIGKLYGHFEARQTAFQ